MIPLNFFERTAKRLACSRRATAEMEAPLWVVVPQSNPDRVLVRGADRELCLKCQEGQTGPRRRSAVEIAPVCRRLRERL